ncbi:unnamed protein product [Adineta ricciae]|uniref:Hcy-binding domain-containing protein n=2 Tax=Adineta ricciae TaxID=249248 RepID=A0A814EHA1_ADIRI|nr:unnamed protein product [Adineta ricciae]CAF1309536.1 unnamed protein product [Adineta ricciae]
MAKYRNQLPQLSDRFFIISGGLETYLVYQKKMNLPYSATFPVLKSEAGCEVIKDYLSQFAMIAKKYGAGLIFQAVTWRASPDYLKKLGYEIEDLPSIVQQAVDLLVDIRNEYETETTPIVINASMGPRGDGYNPTTIMSPDEAQTYHSTQINAFSQSKADFITAFTLNYPEEAIGIVRAAKAVNMPIAISFTVSSDGRLPTGQSLKDAIEMVDSVTVKAPIYYMINCAHPNTFEKLLDPKEAWVQRIHGFKSNASKKTHEQLDESKELDDGNPQEFGQCNLALLKKLKHVNILGGCCGTDIRHIEETCKACCNACT